MDVKNFNEEIIECWLGTSHHFVYVCLAVILLSLMSFKAKFRCCAVHLQFVLDAFSCEKELLETFLRSLTLLSHFDFSEACKGGLSVVHQA